MTVSGKETSEVMFHVFLRGDLLAFTHSLRGRSQEGIKL